MKKLFVVMMSIVMVIALVACNKAEAPASPVSSNSQNVPVVINGNETQAIVDENGTASVVIDGEKKTLDELAEDNTVSYEDGVITVKPNDDNSNPSMPTEETIVPTQESTGNDSVNTVSETPSQTAPVAANDTPSTKQQPEQITPSTTVPEPVEEVPENNQTETPVEEVPQPVTPAEPTPSTPSAPVETDTRDTLTDADDAPDAPAPSQVAGKYYDYPDASRPSKPSADTSEPAAIKALNNYIFPAYGRQFYQGGGIGTGPNGPFHFAEIGKEGGINHATDYGQGRWMVRVFGWRKSYDSDVATNSALNCVLEAFRYFSGDKDVAKALWKWIDAANINGYANSDDYGFHDVETLSDGFVCEMNGVQIEVHYANNVTTLYFNY